MTTGEKREKQTRPGGEFLVVAAKQKAHGNVGPSLLWYMVAGHAGALSASVLLCRLAPL